MLLGGCYKDCNYPHGQCIRNGEDTEAYCKCSGDYVNSGMLINDKGSCMVNVVMSKNLFATILGLAVSLLLVNAWNIWSRGGGSTRIWARVNRRSTRLLSYLMVAIGAGLKVADPVNVLYGVSPWYTGFCNFGGMLIVLDSNISILKYTNYIKEKNIRLELKGGRQFSSYLKFGSTTDSITNSDIDLRRPQRPFIVRHMKKVMFWVLSVAIPWIPPFFSEQLGPRYVIGVHVFFAVLVQNAVAFRAWANISGVLTDYGAVLSGLDKGSLMYPKILKAMREARHLRLSISLSALLLNVGATCLTFYPSVILNPEMIWSIVAIVLVILAVDQLYTIFLRKQDPAKSQQGRSASVTDLNITRATVTQAEQVLATKTPPPRNDSNLKLDVVVVATNQLHRQAEQKQQQPEQRAGT